jgi:hypothetical protein
VPKTALILLTFMTAVAKNDKKPKSHADPIVSVRFGATEMEVIRGHYITHPNNLPPGLQKKLARGKALLPGWQKKLHPFPPQLEARLPFPCGYCGRGVVDEYGVIYDKRTSIVLDIVR